MNDFQVVIGYKFKDEKWLNKLIKDNNVEVENIFYAFYTKNKTYVIKKDEVI